MTKRSSRFLTILAAVAVPVALVMAPSVAVAKKPKKVKINLQGPITHSKDPGYTPYSHLCCFPSYTPTIQIKARFGGKKQPKVEVTAYGLWGPCSGAEYSDGESKEEISLKPKKNGTFGGTHTEFGRNTLTVTGQILRRSGTASGTVHLVEDRGPPSNSHAYGICDSGTVTWTASKVAVLSDVKASYDPSLVYPAGL